MLKSKKYKEINLLDQNQKNVPKSLISIQLNNKYPKLNYKLLTSHYFQYHKKVSLYRGSLLDTTI